MKSYGFKPFDDKIKELMRNQIMKMEVALINEIAEQRSKVGGGCKKMMKTLFQSLKKNRRHFSIKFYNQVIFNIFHNLL